MNEGFFHERYGTKRPAAGLIYEDVPTRVASGLANILEKLPEEHMPEPEGLWESITDAFDERPGYEVGDFDDLAAELEKRPWDEFCTACEVIFVELKPSARDTFANRLNALFLRHHFGYEMRDGKLERVGAKSQEQALAVARGILSDTDLTGPDEQFQKAINAYNRRPKPDYENTVKDAIGALEGLARILTENPKMVLATIMKTVAQEKGLHPTLVAIFEKLYAYRGDKDGVGHGKVAAGNVTAEEAEFVLGATSSAMVYLARLYGRGVT